MITAWQTYWLTRMDALVAAVAVAGGASITVSIIVMILKEKIIKESQFGIFFGIILMLLSVFIPTTKDMAAILIIPKITNAIENSEQLKTLPYNEVELVNEWVKELKPRRKGKP